MSYLDHATSNALQFSSHNLFAFIFMKSNACNYIISIFNIIDYLSSHYQSRLRGFCMAEVVCGCK